MYKQDQNKGGSSGHVNTEGENLHGPTQDKELQATNDDWRGELVTSMDETLIDCQIRVVVSQAMHTQATKLK